MRTVLIAVEVNGEHFQRRVEARLTLSDFIRDDIGLTGTQVGCEQGICGTCTVLLDGAPVRSCLTLAAQADGRTVSTIEGLSRSGAIAELQSAFSEAHALQCGFCTPGMLVTAHAFLQQNASPTKQQAREAISGNLCRCTGYASLVDAVVKAAES